MKRIWVFTVALVCLLPSGNDAQQTREVPAAPTRLRVIADSSDCADCGTLW